MHIDYLSFAMRPIPLSPIPLAVCTRTVRVRKTTPSLLNEHGQSVADGLIANALGGMDRAAYKAMFSLDDDTLEGGD